MLRKDTVEHLSTKVEKAGKALTASKKLLMLLEDLVAEQVNQLLSKDAEAKSHHRDASKMENQVADPLGS